MTLAYLEKAIFFLYIILLPFEAFHPLGLNRFGAFAKTPSFLFFAIGLVLAILSCRGKIVLDSRNYFKRLCILIASVSLISIFMATILYTSIEPILGFHTLDVIWGPIVNNIILILILYYVFYMSQKVDKKFIDQALNVIYTYTLILGYIQLGAIFGIGFLSSVLSIFEKIGLTYSTELCLNNSRIVLMFSEPSYVEILVCGLLLPFICGQYLVAEKKTISMFKVGLLLPLVFFNGSSSVLLGTVICIGVTVFLSAKRKELGSEFFLKFFIVVALLIVLVISDNPVKELLVRQVLQKPFDQDNLSTVQRASVIRNCLMVFLEYPILGVGNGVQGFFYESHLLPSDYKSYEVVNALKYENGIPGAGSWAGGWISGYGLVGTILLAYFIFTTVKRLKEYKNTEYYYAYIIGGICFLICGWFTASTTGGYLSLFVLTIPTFSAKYFCEGENDEYIHSRLRRKGFNKISVKVF